MATNRTASLKWKRLRARKISESQRLGLTSCPTCGKPFAFGTYRQPLSPELSHIVPVAAGGEDSDENTFLECYNDNRGRGGKMVGAEPPAVRSGTPPVEPFPLRSSW